MATKTEVKKKPAPVQANDRRKTVKAKEAELKKKKATLKTNDRRKIVKAKEAELNKQNVKKKPTGSKTPAKVKVDGAKQSIPKAVRDMMITKKQDAHNKANASLRSDNRLNRTTKSSVEKMIKEATDKGRSAIKGASNLVKLARIGTGIGAFLSADEVGTNSDKIPAGMEDAFVKKMDAERKKREAKLKKKGATADSDSQLTKKAKANKKTGKEKYRHGKSAGGVSFNEAFKYWKGEGNKTFTWNGKKYNTLLAKS